MSSNYICLVTQCVNETLINSTYRWEEQTVVFLCGRVDLCFVLPVFFTTVGFFFLPTLIINIFFFFLSIIIFPFMPLCPHLPPQSHRNITLILLSPLGFFFARVPGWGGKTSFSLSTWPYSLFIFIFIFYTLVKLKFLKAFFPMPLPFTWFE